MARKLRGLASSKRHAKKTDKRWVQKFNRQFVSNNQCGNCRFFVPSNGAFAIEWGVCSNASSQLDRFATLATYGCEHFLEIGELPLYWNLKHVGDTHDRWVNFIDKEHLYRPGHLQCGACRFYVSLDGYFITDWGMCTNLSSEQDGIPMFEHDSCDHHVYCPQGWNGPYPQAHYTRNAKYKDKLR